MPSCFLILAPVAKWKTAVVRSDAFCWLIDWLIFPSDPLYTSTVSSMVHCHFFRMKIRKRLSSRKDNQSFAKIRMPHPGIRGEAHGRDAPIQAAGLKTKEFNIQWEALNAAPRCTMLYRMDIRYGSRMLKDLDVTPLVHVKYLHGSPSYFISTVQYSTCSLSMLFNQIP